jgi:hypothetical protein
MSVKKAGSALSAANLPLKDRFQYLYSRYKSTWLPGGSLILLDKRPFK